MDMGKVIRRAEVYNELVDLDFQEKITVLSMVMMKVNLEHEKAREFLLKKLKT